MHIFEQAGLIFFFTAFHVPLKDNPQKSDML